MGYKIQNNSNHDLSQLTSLVQEYYPYARKSMGFNRDAAIIFESDMENANNPLGKTAYYNPSDYSVTIYVDKRHPKDIMRSLNHELVHHSQNCAGKFENLGPTEEGYAQSDPYLREMEEEAYKDMTFRDWENQKNIKEKKTMNLTEKKLRAVIREAIQKALGEQSKTDSPDRVGGRDAGGRRTTPLEEVEDETVEEIVSPEMATSVQHDPHVVDQARETLELVAAGRFHLPESVIEVLQAVAAAAEGGPGRIGPEDLAEEKDEEDEEKKKQEDEFGNQLAGAGSGVNEVDVKEGSRRKSGTERGRPKGLSPAGEEEEDTEEEKRQAKADLAMVKKGGGEKRKLEEEDPTLKEWYEGSLYGKLLKEYTKKR